MSSVRLKAFPPQKIQTFRLIAEQVGKFWIKCVEAIGPLVGANKDGGRLELPEGGVDEPNLQVPLLGRFRKVVAEVEISQLRAGSALLTKHRRLPQQSAMSPSSAQPHGLISPRRSPENTNLVENAEKGRSRKSVSRPLVNSWPLDPTG